MHIITSLLIKSHAALAVSVKDLENQGLITTSFQRYVGLFINGVLGVLGSISLLMFIYAALLWLTDLGDGAKVKKAKTILIWSVFGLVLIFSSYLLTNFLFQAVTETTIAPAIEVATGTF